ncbi:penicillin-binding protein activator [Thioflexithrix psekupsensis]|uniref:Penicillin-binding protein activator n=1 Tax=Thioflexithrix psekupsensis TaxID=1570016 RepID=A0A251X7Q8_9GAMM|nr:penicillin-binding protein activator [Thioflexithrix psekupsensis]OUD13239.1 hypothetical protein TPSD3_11430 [Thioflexithrix psekupsensis]
MTLKLTLLPWLFMLFLSGCVSVPLIGSGQTDPAQTSDPTQHARRFEQQGNYLAAAKSYIQLATKAKPPLQQEYYLSAVESYLKGNMFVEARIELSRLNLAPAPQLMPRQQIAAARLDIAEGQPLLALQRLQQVVPPPEWRVPYQQTQILALEAQGNLVQAVQARVALSNLLTTDRPALLANHDQLWKLLAQIPDTQLTELMRQQQKEVQGWVSLALLVRHSSAATRLPLLLSNWQSEYPQHPATIDIIPMLQQGKQPTLPVASRRIALLLPLSGQFKVQAEAIRDGFVAAWYADGGANNRSEIDIQDVTGKNAQQVYQEAVNNGATVVVGPLERDSILQLASGQSSLPVPTLALNYVPMPNYVANLFQFGLAPDREAVTVALRAWADGHRRAIVVVPQGAWGDRVGAAFRDTWTRQGGQVIRTQVYGSDNISTVLKALGNASTDAVLLGAYPREARMIVPFFTGRSMAIYGTSAVYSDAVQRPDLNRDLEGLLFGDMPWVLAPDSSALQLQNTIQQQWPALYREHSRVYAFGVDAYQVLRTLVQARPGTQHQGQTGLLTFNNNGDLDRGLMWARFINGTASPMSSDGVQRMAE